MGTSGYGIRKDGFIAPHFTLDKYLTDAILTVCGIV